MNNRARLSFWLLLGIAVAALIGSSSSYAASVFTNGFEAAEGGGEEPPDSCVDPLVFPPGWRVDSRTWTQTFSAPDGRPIATYPNGVSWPVAVGAEKGRIKIVPFTPTPRQSVNAYFDQVQARPQDGYYRSRPAASMFMAITPCGADVRPPDYFALDPFQRRDCRDVMNFGSLVWTTGRVAGACHVEAGRTYWLVFMAADPRDGLTLGEHTCEDVSSTDSGCDVGIVFSTGPEGKAREWVLRKAFGLPLEN